MTPTMTDGPDEKKPAPDGDWSEEELREVQAIIDEVREEIWLEKQGVQKPIIVPAEPEIN